MNNLLSKFVHWTCLIAFATAQLPSAYAYDAVDLEARKQSSEENWEDAWEEIELVEIVVPPPHPLTAAAPSISRKLTVQALPPEVLQEIVKWASFEGLTQLGQACKAFYDLSKYSPQWKTACLNRAVSDFDGLLYNVKEPIALNEQNLRNEIDEEGALIRSKDWQSIYRLQKLANESRDKLRRPEPYLDLKTPEMRRGMKALGISIAIVTFGNLVFLALPSFGCGESCLPTRNLGSVIVGAGAILLLWIDLAVNAVQFVCKRYQVPQILKSNAVVVETFKNRVVSFKAVHPLPPTIEKILFGSLSLPKNVTELRGALVAMRLALEDRWDEQNHLPEPDEVYQRALIVQIQDISATHSLLSHTHRGDVIKKAEILLRKMLPQMGMVVVADAAIEAEAGNQQ